MRRFLLILVLVLVVTAVVAGPASAWYAPKAHTAYVTIFLKTGWDEWAGPSDPLNMISHTGAIPHGWKVVMKMSWADSETGARLAPLLFDRTLAFSKVKGSWSLKVLKPQKAVRFWSPAYEYDAATRPGVWARDWWVPLGRLAKGRYKGWVREQVVSEFPMWLDDNWNVLSDPVWSPAYTTTFSRSFRVK